MQGRELLARRYFAPRRVGDCFRVGYFALRRVWDCFRVGILLRILRHSYGVHPVTLVYQGLRYRLPLPKVFRPVGACFIRDCATAYPCLRSFAPSGLVYQGLRYRLPLSKVFRPVGAIR